MPYGGQLLLDQIFRPIPGLHVKCVSCFPVFLGVFVGAVIALLMHLDKKKDHHLSH